MSWAEDALSRAALEAARIQDARLREAAVEGLAELAPAARALERRGRAALTGVLIHLVADDVPGARKIAPTSDPLGQALALLDEARAEVREVHAEAEQERQDWADIWAALGRAGMAAGKVGLSLLLAAAKP